MHPDREKSLHGNVFLPGHVSGSLGLGLLPVSGINDTINDVGLELI